MHPFSNVVRSMVGFSLATTLGLTLFGPAISADASTRLWEGDQDNNWNTNNAGDTNWMGNAAVPVNTDSVVFVDSANLTSNNNIAGLTLNNWIFDSDAPAYLIYGNGITLTGTLTNNAIAGTQKIFLDIGGTGSVTQSGAGTLTLAGTNTFTGTTSVTGGTLSISGSIASTTVSVSAAGTLTINGGAAIANFAAVSNAGTFNVTASETIGSLAGAGGTAISNAQTLTTADATNTTVSGVISGAGNLTKAGTGKMTLSGANTFTGATTVTGGTLTVTGSIASTTVDVYGVATLSGSGSILGNVVMHGGVIAPGSDVGTLTVGGLTLSTTSALKYNLDAINAAASDQIQINGHLVLDGVLDISILNGTQLTASSYRLLTYTGSLTDNGLLLGSSIPSGYQLAIDAVNKQVNLVTIPEPASLALMAISGMTLLVRSNRRMA